MVMETKSQNFIKNYFLEKLLEARLFFIKQKSDLTDFFEEVKKVKKMLIILPIDKSEEGVAREYLPQIQKVFGRAKISTLDLSTLRKTDTNWLGVPNNKYLANIQGEDFDLLLDLNGHHDRVCAYLCALTAAPMRLHVSEGKFDKIYNLQFRIPGGAPLSSRYQNMLAYIDLMRQKPA
jgi:hypothetical protein